MEGKGWIFADELQVGDKLQKADGSSLTIDEVEFVKLDEPITVYNFTVADYHTYYVTDLGIWVHNTECKVGDVTSGGRNFTQHGAEQANARGYSSVMVDDIVDNWTKKAYQPGGRTIYAQRKNDGYHVVVLDKANNIVSVIGGAKGSNTLKDWADVKRMMTNQGGFSESPFGY